jgi:peptidoglycan/xylan/chitin deacetylase (PgdA/CDA1 family)
MIKRLSILIASIFLFSMINIAAASAAPEKIVLLATDDFQVWWLEDIQERLVQTYIDNSIPVTLGVIPAGIEDPWGAGDRIIERIQRWDAYSFLEVAQHGYDHEVFLEGMSYNNQYSRLKKGNDLMKSVGVFPTSLIPPFGSADANTVKALKALGFHTIYNPIEMTPVSDPEILIIQDQVLLCKNNADGRSCVFKDYNNVVSEIESKIQSGGVALVLFHMQDFESSNGAFNSNKANQIVDYANRLRQAGYTLMTVEQYYQHQLGGCIPETEICDGLDNDCDGLTDEDDVCGPVCEPTTEVCDGLDNDCDGLIDEDLTRVTICGIGACAGNTGEETCTAGIWSGDTCDPSAGAAADDATCDGLDNDCDGTNDEDYVLVSTGCGVGECQASGTLSCVAGSEVDSCTPETPTDEICDGLDNDCDGLTDEDNICDPGCEPTEEICDNSDNDCDGKVDEDLGQTTCGIGECELTVQNCVNGETQVCVPGDSKPEICDSLDNDCDGEVDEGGVCDPVCIPAEEVCDGIDNDCDGEIDEGYVETPTTCGIGICSSTGFLQCVSGSEQDSCIAGVPETEICNNQLDDDCDGNTDLEDIECTNYVCCKGDLNEDGVADLEDVAILVNKLKDKSSYRVSSGDCADFDNSGRVNRMDLFLLLVDLVSTSDWSYSC